MTKTEKKNYKERLKEQVKKMRKENIIGKTPWVRTEGYNEAVSDFLELLEHF